MMGTLPEVGDSWMILTIFDIILSAYIGIPSLTVHIMI